MNQSHMVIRIQEAALSYAAMVQEWAVSLLAGPAGLPVIALAAIGLATLVARLASWGLRSVGVRRRGAPASTPTNRARTLALYGAEPAEIARAVGLSRDALAIALRAESMERTKLPVTAHSAVSPPPRAINRTFSRTA